MKYPKSVINKTQETLAETFRRAMVHGCLLEIRYLRSGINGLSAWYSVNLYNVYIDDERVAKDPARIGIYGQDLTIPVSIATGRRLDKEELGVLVRGCGYDRRRALLDDIEEAIGFMLSPSQVRLV